MLPSRDRKGVDRRRLAAVEQVSYGPGQ